MTIDDLVAACVTQIEISHSAREAALRLSRELIRACSVTIRAAHRAEFAEATALLAKAAAVAAGLRNAVAQHPELAAAGYSRDALKEYAEAHLVLAFLQQMPPPSAAALGIEPDAYLNGLAEAASELRRAILDDLRRGDMARCEALLAIIDDVYSALVTVDYPDAITGGLRRTTDALRAVLERTRGDVTAALRQEQLVATMRALEARLGGEAT